MLRAYHTFRGNADVFLIKVIASYLNLNFKPYFVQKNEYSEFVLVFKQKYNMHGSRISFEKNRTEIESIKLLQLRYDAITLHLSLGSRVVYFTPTWNSQKCNKILSNYHPCSYDSNMIHELF